MPGHAGCRPAVWPTRVRCSGSPVVLRLPCAHGRIRNRPPNVDIYITGHCIAYCRLPLLSKYCRLLPALAGCHYCRNITGKRHVNWTNRRQCRTLPDIAYTHIPYESRCNTAILHILQAKTLLLLAVSTCKTRTVYCDVLVLVGAPTGTVLLL